MTTLIPEVNGTSAATVSNKKPRPSKKTIAAPRRTKVAPAKAK